MNRKVSYIIIAILIFFGILAVGYFWLFKTKPELKTGILRVGGASLNVEIADTLRTRAQGLSGRSALAETSGMYFVFQIPTTYSFWMKDMRFPLDMVWVRNGKITGITENVPPPSGGITTLQTYSPPGAVDAVLEINAGESRRLGIKTGDAVILEQ